MICPGFGRSLSIFRQIIICKNDDDDFRISGFYFPGDVEAIRPGQSEVHKDRIGRESPYFLHCFLSVPCFENID